MGTGCVCVQTVYLVRVYRRLCGQILDADNTRNLLKQFPQLIRLDRTAHTRGSGGARARGNAVVTAKSHAAVEEAQKADVSRTWVCCSHAAMHPVVQGVREAFHHGNVGPGGPAIQQTCAHHRHYRYCKHHDHGRRTPPHHKTRRYLLVFVVEA